MISVLDHGFLYGLSLFETFRTYGGSPFLLSRHLTRLADGCRAVGIELPRGAELARVQRHVAELLQAQGLRDGYVRYTVTAGEAALGLPETAYMTPNVVVYAKPLPPAAPLAARGKALQLLRTRRNSPEGDVRLKSAHYMNNILAKRELGETPSARATHGAPAEGLMLNTAGHLTEGIVSNVFFVKNGVCYTPAVDTGILPGITRGFVLELAQQAGIKAEEGYYSWEDLLEADEVFITNSIQEIVPIHTLYGLEHIEWRVESRSQPTSLSETMDRSLSDAGLLSSIPVTHLLHQAYQQAIDQHIKAVQ